MKFKKYKYNFNILMPREEAITSMLVGRLNFVGSAKKSNNILHEMHCTVHKDLIEVEANLHEMKKVRFI